MAERKPLTKQRSPWHELAPNPKVTAAIGEHKVYVRNVSDGQLRAIVAHEPGGLHLSISFVDPKSRPTRYPRWDEIADARDLMLPADLAFVMHLPAAGEYVALHDSTFHLYQHPPIEPAPRTDADLNDELVAHAHGRTS